MCRTTVDDTYCTKSSKISSETKGQEKRTQRCTDHRGAKQRHTGAHQDWPSKLALQQQIVCTWHCSLDLLQFLNNRSLFLLNWEVFDTHEITNFADHLKKWDEIQFCNLHSNQYNNRIHGLIDTAKKSQINNQGLQLKHHFCTNHHQVSKTDRIGCFTSNPLMRSSLEWEAEIHILALASRSGVAGNATVTTATQQYGVGHISKQ